MYKEPWKAKVNTEKRVLILGESHYDTDGTLTTTTELIERYLNGKYNWLFFNRIAKSFGYDENLDEFWNKVYFGNYVEDICGIQDDKANVSIRDNRENYNTSLFDFVNDNSIDTIVCFSKKAYYSMPGLKKGSFESDNNTTIGKLGERNNNMGHCIYGKGLDHSACQTVLKNDLSVYAFGHPSAAGGYSVEDVKNMIYNIEELSCIRK